MATPERSIYRSDTLSVPDFVVPYMHAHAGGDFNGDGLTDIVASFTDFGRPTRNEIRILLADGKGGFVDATATVVAGAVPSFHQVREIVVADFNRDGRDDIFFAAQGIDTPPALAGEPNALLLSGPDGRYRATTFPLSDFTHSVAAGDVNGDGAADLFVGNFLAGGTYRQPYFLINDGSGGFVRRTEWVPRPELANTGPQIGASLLADIDGDGRADLILGDWGSGVTRAYLGNGTGNFAGSVQRVLPTPRIDGKHANAADVQAADLDGDGDLDLVLSFIGAPADANDPNSYSHRAVQVLINDGKGNFGDETAARLPRAADAGSSGPAQWFVFLELVDFNRDGLVDILAKNLNTAGQPAASGTPVLWLNVGRGSFHPFTERSFGNLHGNNGYPGPFEIVDADGDGGRDLLTIGYRPELLRQVEPLTRANGTPADDWLLASAGNDRIDGGAGIDTLLLSARRAEIRVTIEGPRATVSGPDGRDELVDVERLALRDGVLALDLAGHAGQAYRIYQAAFDRTPDAGGLGYWIDRMDAGTGLLEVAAGFLASAEARAVYGAAPSAGDFVQRLYQNVLGRAGEPGGVAFWEGELAQGTSRAAVLAGFSESAENVALVGQAIGSGIWLAGA